MNVIKYHEPWLIERFSRAADDSYFSRFIYKYFRS